MTDKISTYIWPGDTHFGYGAADLLGAEARARGIARAMVLTDGGVQQAGLLAPLLASLTAAGIDCSTYDAIPGNPDIAAVDAAVAAFINWRADGVVAVGGGSVMDAAKGVRLVAGGAVENGQAPPPSIGHYALPLGERARPAPPAALLPPMLALPTTAGTGAEVTPWGVITDLAAGRKFGIGGPYLLPTAALIDPALTLTLPPGLTAATGLDALSHLIEAYVSTNNNPALDPLILHGIELIGRSLPVAVAQPGQRTAREEVMLAAMLGGIAISSNWLGACHSLAHPLSALADLHHGVAIGVMLPHQMAFSLVGAPERYAQVGERLLGTRLGRRSSRRARAEQAVAAVTQLLQDVGLPTRLGEAGVEETLIPALGQAAYKDTNWMTNPRLVEAGHLEQLYRAAF